MSEHQSGAGGAPDRGPGMDARGQGGSPDAAANGPAPQGGSGYGGPAAGAAAGQGGASPYGQAGGAQAGCGEHAGGQTGYGAPHGGQGEAMGPQLGQAPFMVGGAGAMPPGYPPYQYAHPAPGQGYYAAPHYVAPAHYGQYVGYPPPPPGAYPPDAFQVMHQGHAYGAGQGAGPGAGQAQGASMSDLMNEVASGGNGLSALSKMLNFDDPDFWKGALVGAAAVLLLTSDSVQSALFGGGAGENGNGKGSST